MFFGDTLQYFSSLFFILEVTKPQPVAKAEEPTKIVVEEEKPVMVEKIAPQTGISI